MFRHLGNARTLNHNLKIASLLSFVAGAVSIAGLFAVHQLTTNITGHFIFFVDEVYKVNSWMALIYLLYILFFSLGSIVSNFIIELLSRKDSPYIYEVPVVLECLILFVIGFWGQDLMAIGSNLIACILLFAMGLQNSLVTKISSASVRTTHLTGLFTDLGIDISQLFFHNKNEQKDKIFSSIKLRFTIILFFFIGGMVGGFLYTKIKLHTLTFIAAILVIGLIYNNIKFNIRQQRKIG